MANQGVQYTSGALGVDEPVDHMIHARRVEKKSQKAKCERGGYSK